MLSYNNDESLKAKAVALAEHHRDADMLVTGSYGEKDGKVFKGCSVGCFLYDLKPRSWMDIEDKHEAVAEELSLPKWLVRLQDSIFEGLPAAERANFHVELAKRIPVGVNLEPVQHLIAIARLERLIIEQTAALDKDIHADIKTWIREVIAVLEIVKRAQLAAAGRNVCDLPAADSATYFDAYSAAYSATYSAAYSDARSAADSARSSAAYSAAWKLERDSLFAALDKVSL